MQFRQEHVYLGHAAHSARAAVLHDPALGGGNDIVVKAFDEIHRKSNLADGGSDSATEQMHRLRRCQWP